VVGASGFVGRHVVEALRARGDDVVAVPAPRLRSSGRDVATLLAEVGGVLDHLAPDVVPSGIDVLVNAAGMSAATHPGGSDLVGANALLPAVLAAAAARSGVQRLVHVSSAAVQGTSHLLDSSSRRRPENAYARSKALGEEALERSRPGSLDIVIYRPPGVHSPDRAVTRSIRALAAGRWSWTTAPGTAGSPQSLVANVADAVAYLTRHDDPPPVVHHPSEGVSTAGLLLDLGGHPPHLLPRPLGAALIRGADLAARVVPRLGGHASRVRILLAGQPQAPSWLTQSGWQPVVGPEGWRALATVPERPLRAIMATTVHERHDTRVFHKMAADLARADGVDFRVVVADGGGDLAAPVQVHDVGAPPAGRLGRMTFSPLRVLRHALGVRPDVFHLHDPELLPVGWLLARTGVQVVYDVHEDVPKDILDKHWIHPRVRPVVSWLVDRVERGAAGGLSAVVAATPSIATRFDPRTTTLVQNFPRLDEFPVPTRTTDAGVTPSVVYLGAMNEIRGLVVLVDAIAIVNRTHPCRLRLAGPFTPPPFEAVLRSRPGWRYVDALGVVGRSDLDRVFDGAVAGAVTFLPAHNHIDAQPNKLFEYLAAGRAVVASDFPRWRELIEAVDCGLLVDPTDPVSVATAVVELLDDPERSARLGRNGRRAIEETYNWDVESTALTALYARLADNRGKR
jgi:glycosyltransferase involved in cell wall biosynthesis/nucleoside-diphosphate-sugar epimerase